MAEYLTMAVIHILVGLEVTMFGFLSTETDWYEDEVEALLIIGVLLLIPTAVLVVLVKAGDLAGNIIATCFALAFAIASGKTTVNLPKIPLCPSNLIIHSSF